MRPAAIVVVLLLILGMLSGCTEKGPTAKDRELKELRRLYQEAYTRLLELEEKSKERILVKRPETCMIRLLGLPPEWKERLHLHLLKFADEGVSSVDAMARADVKKGNYNILTGGLNVWHGQPTKTLRKEHGIIVMEIATCTDGRVIFDMMGAYNAVSIPAIKRKFGERVIEEALKAE